MPCWVYVHVMSRTDCVYFKIALIWNQNAFLFVSKSKIRSKYETLCNLAVMGWFSSASKVYPVNSSQDRPASVDLHPTRRLTLALLASLGSLVWDFQTSHECICSAVRFSRTRITGLSRSLWTFMKLHLWEWIDRPRKLKVLLVFNPSPHWNHSVTGVKGQIYSHSLNKVRQPLANVYHKNYTTARKWQWPLLWAACFFS